MAMRPTNETSPLSGAELFLLAANTPLGLLTASAVYPSYTPGTPSLHVIKRPWFLPRDTNGTVLSEDYMLSFVENDVEDAWCRQALRAPLPTVGGEFDLRQSVGRPNAYPSAMPPTTDPRIILYEPPAENWPHIVASMLPDNVPGRGFARQRYGWDAYPSLEAALAFMAEQRDAMAAMSGGEFSYRVVSPEGVVSVEAEAIRRTSDLVERLTTQPLSETFESATYPGFTPGVPEIELLRFPPEVLAISPSRQDGSLTAQYMPIFMETMGDIRYVQSCLRLPLKVAHGVVDFSGSIDVTNARRSVLAFHELALLHYAPEKESWPHIIVAASPILVSGMGMARDRYLWMFAQDEEDVALALEKLAYMVGLSGVRDFDIRKNLRKG